MKKFGASIGITLFFLATAAACIYLDLLIYIDTPTDPQAMEQVVMLKPGQGFSTFSNQLYELGVIDHPGKFKLFARIKGYDKQIKAGEYLLSSAMPPLKIFKIILSGKVRLHRLTIPEGYNLWQVARIVTDSGFGTETDFLKAATNAELVHAANVDAETLEGYLFPDTYYFAKGASPEQIVSTMVKRFWSVFKPEWKEQAQTLGLTIHEVVTLASIIEKETGVAEERPLISSVFHNRLKRRMRLESDPTVIYGIKDFDGNLTRKHLALPTPYNTYTMKGLPAGPIANCGVQAIEAALFPAETDFLYFVSKRDQTHQFSTNIKDHNRFVRKYQLRR